MWEGGFSGCWVADWGGRHWRRQRREGQSTLVKVQGVADADDCQRRESWRDREAGRAVFGERDAEFKGREDYALRRVGCAYRGGVREKGGEDWRTAGGGARAGQVGEARRAMLMCEAMERQSVMETLRRRIAAPCSRLCEKKNAHSDETESRVRSFDAAPQRSPRAEHSACIRRLVAPSSASGAASSTAGGGFSGHSPCS